MSSSASLGAESAKKVPIRNMPVLPPSRADVASWNGKDLPFGSKYGSASFHLVKTALTFGSSKRPRPASRSRWNGAPLIRMFR